jgi:protein-S-isoprenylcysteine O-methyltransferase Ste14
MAVVALIAMAVWLGVTIGLRTFVHVRRIGTWPMLVPPPFGTPAWWARSVASLGMLLLLAAPVADWLGLPPIGLLDRPALRWLGVAVTAVGTAWAFVSQGAMGDAWRGDVDPDARQPLVTTGPFRIVRNPVLLGTFVVAAGIVLVVPNVLAVVALALIGASMTAQVRLVEEPYLLRVHGDDYRRYAARTGRFLPGIGRLPGR